MEQHPPGGGATTLAHQVLSRVTGLDRLVKQAVDTVNGVEAKDELEAAKTGLAELELGPGGVNPPLRMALDRLEVVEKRFAELREALS